jgi:hypothetical protein
MEGGEGRERWHERGGKEGGGREREGWRAGVRKNVIEGIED